MNLCQCNVCLLARARFITDLAARGVTEWWHHRQRMNEKASQECESARAQGYVDPPSRFARGIPA
jgi:hypothetical protein